MHREGWCFLFVKRAQAGVVLGSRFFQANVVAHNPDDVCLLLQGLCEIGSQSHEVECRASGPASTCILDCELEGEDWEQWISSCPVGIRPHLLPTIPRADSISFAESYPTPSLK